MRLPRWHLLIALPALCLMAGGCAHRTVVSRAAAAEPSVVTRNFKWVYITGSHIPVAVPTDPAVQALPTISPLSIYTPDEIRRTGGPLH